MKPFGSISIGSLLFMYASFACGNAAAVVPDIPKQLWSVNVPETSVVPSKHDKKRRNALDGVIFVSSNVLIKYSVTFDPSQLSTNKTSEITSSYKVTLRTFSVSTGKQLTFRSWDTRMPYTSVHAATGGVLLQTDNRLILLNDSLEVIKTSSLGADTAGSHRQVSVSADGNVVLYNEYDSLASHFILLDGATLNEVSSWSERPPLRFFYSVSDHEIAAADGNQQSILLTKFGSGRWVKLNGGRREGCLGTPELIDDDLIVTGCNAVELVAADGAIVASVPLESSSGMERTISIAKSR